MHQQQKVDRMGKKSSKTPDVVGAATAEGAASREATRDQTYANRPDQYNPFGSSTWQTENIIDPATGEATTKWRNTQNLSPDSQDILDNQVGRVKDLSGMSNAMGDRIQDEMGSPLDWGQFGDVMAGPSASGPIGGGIDPTTGEERLQNSTGGNVGGGVNATTDANNSFEWDSNNRGRAEDAAYGRSAQRLDPRFASQRQDLERQMQGRGLRAGDSAYDSAMENFNTGRNDAYEMARMGSVGEGRAEDQQAYGQALGQYGANRGTEQQAFGQNIAAGANERAADQQRFGQAATEFGANRAAEQQRYGQQLAGGQNDRAADQQSFDQQMGSNERANALRQQQIGEYLGKRSTSLGESNALAEAANRDINQTTSTFGGG
jgi:hypothetical protein